MPPDQIFHPEAVDGSPIAHDRLVEIKQQIPLHCLHHGRIFDAQEVAQDQAIRTWLTLRSCPTNAVTVRRRLDRRDVLIHDYLRVNLEQVWETVVRDLPPLGLTVRSLIERHMND